MIRLERLAHSSWISVVLLLGVNAIPIVSVLYLGRDVFTLLIRYWIESGVVGVIIVFKIVRSEGVGSPSSMTIKGLATTSTQRGCLIP